MSRGHGRIQTQVMAVLRETNDTIDSIEIAGRVFDTTAVNQSQHVSVRRALRKLASEGLVVDMGRHWRQGRRHWATPEVADQVRTRYREQFGEEFWA